MKTLPLIIIFALLSCGDAWGDYCGKEGCLVFHGDEHSIVIELDEVRPTIDVLHAQIGSLKKELEMALAVQKDMIKLINDMERRLAEAIPALQQIAHHHNN